MTSARAECNLETGENLETVAIQKQLEQAMSKTRWGAQRQCTQGTLAHHDPSKDTVPLFLLEFTGCLESGGGGAFLSELLPPHAQAL